MRKNTTYKVQKSRAYTLVKTEPTKEFDIVEEVTGNKGIVEAVACYGTYDAVVTIGTGKLDKTKAIIEDLGKRSGVLSTETLLVATGKDDLPIGFIKDDKGKTKYCHETIK